jgi:hypothetical protein
MVHNFSFVLIGFDFLIIFNYFKSIQLFNAIRENHIKEIPAYLQDINELDKVNILTYKSNISN